MNSRRQPGGVAKVGRTVLAGILLWSAQPAARAVESVLPFSNPTEPAGGAIGLSAAVRGFEGNDPLSVRDYQGDWSGDYHPRSGTNLGLYSVRAELGVQGFGWKVSAVKRREVLIESNPEMTDLYRLYKTKSTAPVGRVFNIALNGNGYEADGWRIDKAWSWKTGRGDEFALGVGYSALQGRKIRDVSAQGSLTSLGGGNYNFAVSSDEAYTSKTYPFITPGTPHGEGQSIDAAIAWKTPQGIRVEAIANDLLGHIRWYDVPATAATARSGVTSTDSNGFIIYAPTLSGRNARRDFTQKIPLRWTVGGEMPWRSFSLIGSFSKLEDMAFPLLGVAWNFSGAWRLQADYDFRLDTVGLKLANSFAFIALRASQVNLSEAQAYGVSAGLALTF